MRLYRIVKRPQEAIRLNGKDFRARHTLAELDVIYSASKGVCEICGSAPGKGKLALDHCHTTGHIRGLLCLSCNVALGHFRDDPDRLRRAIKYLAKHIDAVQ